MFAGGVLNSPWSQGLYYCTLPGARHANFYPAVCVSGYARLARKLSPYIVSSFATVGTRTHDLRPSATEQDSTETP